jgi:polyvinyl alcohol dehydrogenase (cytochrome)
LEQETEFCMIRIIVLAALILLSIPTALAQADKDCASTAAVDQFYTEGWGFTVSNERFQSRSSIDSSNVENLDLKWAFLLDGDMSPHSYPVASEDTVFVGTQGGTLWAIDRDSGCVRWSYAAGNKIRTAVVPGKLPAAAGGEAMLFFGTIDGHTHAVAAATGEVRWVKDIAEHSMTMQTGAPLYYDGRLFVPVSSTELIYAVMPWYGCCTFRGSLIALDAATGEIEWRTYTVTKEPEITGTHSIFVQKWGPSGAPVWSSPTIDAKHGHVLVGTGENYSSPASDMSDAIIAMDIETGSIRWAQQYLANDAFNVGCAIPGHPNCPEEFGPDLDFGAPPIVTRTQAGADVVLAGQKSGGIYAMTADTGERIWETSFGRGGLLGGIHWGMAVNPQLGLLFAPINDMQLFYHISEGESKPGLYALDIATGELRWNTPLEDTCGDRTPCNSGLSAAIAATSDLVFAGGLDGYLRAFDANTGSIVWQFDTFGEFPAVNAPMAQGGTIDVHGPMIAGDMVFIQSGYAAQSLQGGNALLAFALKESKP